MWLQKEGAQEMLVADPGSCCPEVMGASEDDYGVGDGVDGFGAIGGDQA